MPTFLTELETRLTRYCAIDSQSNEDSPTEPSTAIQLDMAGLLAQELAAIGAADIEITAYGSVLATIPATAPGPTVGFLSHVDTAPQFNATGVKPRVIRGYNGGAISYPDNPDLVLSPEMSSELAHKQGHDIVVASGLTLLGADDKAGVAIMMTAARHLLADPSIKHPKLRLAFTTDEEIGRGVHKDLPADLGADFAYTFDGGAVGEIEYESFSADAAVVQIKGVSVHPGLGKGKMVNAIHLAAKIMACLPQHSMLPELTDGLDGFIHATEMTGGSSEMTMKFILRDFELAGLAQKGAILQAVCAAVQAAEPRAQITCTLRQQYRNMRYWLEKDMTPVDLARAAARELGINPVSVAIRGGTDGSRLTELGTPCPNLFTGMQEIHGPLEWISVQDMAQATNLMLKIAQNATR